LVSGSCDPETIQGDLSMHASRLSVYVGNGYLDPDIYRICFCNLTKKQNEKQAWDQLFRYFNQTKHNQDKGYEAGEKIAIKINENNTSAHQNINE
jgi:hypothetical protein